MNSTFQHFLLNLLKSLKVILKNLGENIKNVESSYQVVLTPYEKFKSVVEILIVSLN